MGNVSNLQSNRFVEGLHFTWAYKSKTVPVLCLLDQMQSRSRLLLLEVTVLIPFLSTGAARINNNLKLLVAALNDPC